MNTEQELYFDLYSSVRFNDSYTPQGYCNPNVAVTGRKRTLV